MPGLPLLDKDVMLINHAQQQHVWQSKQGAEAET